MREVWSDRARIQRWLDVEVALARAEASLGIVPDSAAAEIGRKARVERIDLGEMKRELDQARHPIMPLIRCLARVCEPEAAEFIHWGATTQDVLDTGLVLQLRESHLDLVRPETLADSLATCSAIIDLIEGNRVYVNQSPQGEPQLGRRGLYRATGGQLDAKSVERALLWVLNLADGQHSLLDMATRSGLSFDVIRRAATLLEQHELLKEAR